VRASGAASGFTLVELLVAITLLSLLSLMLFGGLRLALRAATTTGALTDRSGEIATAYRFLREALGGAQPVPVDPTVPQPVMVFDGTADALEFAVLPPAYLAPGGFYRLRIAREDNGRHGRLMLQWEGGLREIGQSAAPTVPPSILLDRVGRLDLAYFGRTDESQAASASWQTSWQGRQTLPDLVRLSVIFEDGSQPPPLLVAPRLGSGPGQGL
jgi:general secretion pathway protein J